jgi:hypothetical protein
MSTAAIALALFPVVGKAADGMAFRAIVAPNGGNIRPESGAVCGKPPCTDTPFRTGTIDGYRVLAVLIENGTNGEADKAHLFVHGFGGNGGATADLGVIPAYNGDRMDAIFVRGKLYLVNEIYSPGEAHCCGSHVVATKWGIGNDHLIYFGLHTFLIAQRDNVRALTSARYALHDANWLLHSNAR